MKRIVFAILTLTLLITGCRQVPEQIRSERDDIQAGLMSRALSYEIYKGDITKVNLCSNNSGNVEVSLFAGDDDITDMSEEIVDNGFTYYGDLNIQRISSDEQVEVLAGKKVIYVVFYHSVEDQTFENKPTSGEAINHMKMIAVTDEIVMVNEYLGHPYSITLYPEKGECYTVISK